MRQVFRVFLIVFASGTCWGVPTTQPAGRVIEPYLLLDQPVQIELPGTPDGELGYTHRLLAADGTATDGRGSAKVVAGWTSVRPAGEGIHVLTLGNGVEVRFLAFAPPARSLDEQHLARLLPQTARKLKAGEPVRIVALGDSVTATGAYPQIFATLLSQATGNGNITVETRAHSGRSIDATVRRWDEQVPPLKPDLALLMYGLNDQAASTGLDVFLQQTRWVHAQLKQMGCELILLQPTPHIDPTPQDTDPAYAIRTIGYVEALRPLAAELNVPLAETFNALWDDRHRTLPDASKAMRSLYPRRYSLPFTSLLESDGAGDTIHPNALGHLAMARAAYYALFPTNPSPTLRFTGHTVLDGGVMYSTIDIRNAGDQPWKGSVDLHPPQGTRLTGGEVQIELDLPAGASRSARVEWSDVKAPADLFQPPYFANAVLQPPTVHLVVTCDGRSRVTAVAAPFRSTARIERGRQEVPASAKNATVTVGANEQKSVELLLPGDRDASVASVEFQGQFAQAYLVRFAGALRGEATPDGQLDDWKQHVWRSVSLPSKSRTAPAAAPRVRFAVKAGADRLYMAFDADGDLQGDLIELFFDARPRHEIGTVGPYAWLDCDVQPDGKVKLSPGETSPRPPGPNLQARWQRKGEQGTAVEIAIPYAVFNATAWPADGDLGLGIVWHDKQVVDGRTVTQRVLWSDDAHWWNPTGWGVVRLQRESDDAALPWLVRVR